jgi:hypothetical protein
MRKRELARTCTAIKEGILDSDALRGKNLAIWPFQETEGLSDVIELFARAIDPNSAHEAAKFNARSMSLHPSNRVDHNSLWPIRISCEAIRQIRLRLFQNSRA